MSPPLVIIDLTTASPPPRSPVPLAVRAAPPIPISRAEEKEEDLTLEAVLHREIARVGEGTVRGLLQKICKAHSEAAQMAADVLLVQQKDVRYLSAEESTDEEEEEKLEGEDKKEEQGNEDPSTEKSTNGGNDSNTPDQIPKNPSSNVVANNNTSTDKPISTRDGEESTGKKRYRGKFAICDNCEEQYDVSNNHKGDCTWHDGDLEVDWRGHFWADHDEDCHGEIDSEYMRKQYPEGFEWSCCGMSGNNVEGCKIGRHVERIIRDFKRARYG